MVRTVATHSSVKDSSVERTAPLAAFLKDVDVETCLLQHSGSATIFARNAPAASLIEASAVAILAALSAPTKIWHKAIRHLLAAITQTSAI